jgi:hypothetical protein
VVSRLRHGEVPGRLSPVEGFVIRPGRLLPSLPQRSGEAERCEARRKPHVSPESSLRDWHRGSGRHAGRPGRRLCDLQGGSRSTRRSRPRDRRGPGPVVLQLQRRGSDSSRTTRRCCMRPPTTSRSTPLVRPSPRNSRRPPARSGPAAARVAATPRTGGTHARHRADQGVTPSGRGRRPRPAAPPVRGLSRTASPDLRRGRPTGPFGRAANG